MKKLRVGVIGLGMGRGHIRGYLSHPKAKLVAIADLDEERLKKTGEEFDIEGRYTDYKEMLKEEKLDVVSVATPNFLHKPQTIAALEAGCHVCCEKPMAMNAQEAQDMNDAAKKAKKRIQINFSFRFTEQSWALKKQVESGILGDIYFARTVWHRRRGLPGLGSWFGIKEQAGGGPLIDLGVHRLDLALWLMNYPKPVWVMGSTYNAIAHKIAKEQGKKYDVEDLAAGLIKFENGATVAVEASWAGNVKENDLMETRLWGTEGGLVQKNIGEGYSFEAELYLEKEGSQFDMKLHPPVPGAPNAQYHLIESIVNDTPHVATGEEGKTVMMLLDALYKSAELGEPVKLG
jgi:predicted dehydrogenase